MSFTGSNNFQCLRFRIKICLAERKILCGPAKKLGRRAVGNHWVNILWSRFIDAVLLLFKIFELADFVFEIKNYTVVLNSSLFQSSFMSINAKTAH